MTKKINILLFFFLLLVSRNAFSTHIVGGTLTYLYNGGSSYTITLKLYRDCSAGTAQFPNTVTITVLGYDGAPFSPSRDITMSLGTVTPVPSNLDTCATPPNPMPCTQEGIYTTTVNNLPPNPGGYHLYYQLIARNLSLTNVNAVCNCVGESFYAYIPGPDIVWAEQFPFANGTTIDNGPTAWSISPGATPPNSASVNNNLFQITGANNAQEIWTSQVINIAPFVGGVTASVNLSENGTLDPNDSIFVYYKLNGGPLTLFSINGFIVDDFTTATATQSLLVGNTLEIVIRVHYDAASPSSEIYRFDNVFVGTNNSIVNSNPTFNIFPPLFLCVGEPFTFDHSATDIDGDSLVYEFYNPYNGDNNAGPLDPTFSNNVAIFTNVVFQPGYNFTNPLGPGPFSLNPITGLLTGTPSSLGQYVVGVLVKEYRNGVYLSSTLRDFQFNVITCPTFAQAVLSPITSCNSNTVTFSNLGGSSGANWLWNFGDLTTNADQSTLNNPTYTYPSPGTYTVSLTTGVGTPCANTATANLVVSSTTPAFTSNSPRCIGSAVSFTDNSTVSSNTSISTRLWNFGDGTTSNLENPTHVYSSAGTFTVTLSITSNSNCTDTAIHTVVINPLPIANAGVNQTVCGNNSLITLNGSVINATGGSWTSNGTGTFAPNSSTLNATYTPSSADTAAGLIRFVLSTTGNTVCSPRTDTMFVTISNAPTIANAGPDQIICGTTTALLAANTPLVGTGLWTLVSGIVTITNPSSPTSTITGLVPGSSYTLKWTISSPLCTPTFDLVTINVDLAPSISNAGLDISLCMATNTTLSGNIPSVGSGSWSVVSGTAIIANPSLPNSTVSGLTIGATVVLRWTITQGFCSNSDDVVINVNQNAIVNAGVDQVYCSPTNILLNGSVTVGSTTGVWSTLGTGTFSPNNGILNPTYILSSNDISNGSVTLVLSSTNNSASCPSISDTIRINYSGFNGIISTSTTNVSCFGGTNGTATANISGGISPFTYFWNTAPSQTTQTANGLAQGNYTVTITDGNGCTAQSVANITQPQVLSVSGVKVNISCFGGGNGSIVATPSGGTAPYSYLWTPFSFTSPSISNLLAGTYSLTVTDSKNCQTTASFTLSQPTQLSISTSTSNVNCFGGNTGTATSVATGGTAPYVYNWNPNNSTSSSVTGLAAGSYIVSVTDAALCVVSDTINISQPPELVSSTTSSNETCNNLNNGSATISTSGGTPNYTYLWTPGNFTSSTVNNLSSGNYIVVATDSKGCTNTKFVTISEPNTLTANLINQTDINCFGGNNGSITVNAIGGTPTYLYNWLPGNGNTATINNLIAGTYSVTVTDNNGCTATNSIAISQPSAPLSVSVSNTPALCFGQNTGTASSIPTGGTGPYSFTWTPGNFHTQNIQNLTSGNYSIIVTDSKGCSANNTTNLPQPPQINIVSSSVNSTCSLPNGQAFAIATGGVGNFQYLWSPIGGTNDTAINLPSGNYTVLVTDNNLCTASQIVNVNDATGPSVTIISTTDVSCFGGNDGTATAQITNGTGPFTFQWTPSGGDSTTAVGLSAGFYTIIVIDANLCQSLATTSPAISEPPPLNLDFSTVNVTCNEGSNGSAVANVSGGTPNYNFLWPQLGLTQSSISNVIAGNYVLQITDNNGCIIEDTISITEPDVLAPSIASQTNVSCFGGNNASATINVSGGTPNYSYNWSPNGGNGPSAVGLSFGVYNVSISDGNNCSTAININITQPNLPLNVTATSTPTSCFNGNNGTATAFPTGGTSPYNFQWSPTGGSNFIANGLTVGNYIVNITDDLGCQANATIAVNQPTQMSVSLTPNNTSCGFVNGSINSQITGGTPPYSYLWSNNSTVPGTLSNIGVGNYSLQVTDANGCTSTSINSVPIVNVPGPIVSISSTNPVSCFGGSNGVAIAQINQGTLPYSINWLPFGGNNLVASTLTQGNFTVVVTDALGCTSSASTTINQAQPISILPSSITNVSCNGGNNGQVSLNVQGGTPSYSYSWSPNTSTSSSVSNLSAGTYTVNVLDQNSCTSSISINITQPFPLTSSVFASVNPTCFGGTGSASVIGIGGSVPYTYSWNTNPPQTSSTINNLLAGTTIVTVTDGLGCTTENSAILFEPQQIVTSGGQNDTICIGSSGILTATANGGAGNFIYSWQPSGVINQGTLMVAPPVTTSYYVTATDQNGCVGTTDTVSAIVLNFLPANFNVTGTSPICPGQSTQIAVEISGDVGTLQYQWNNNLGNTIGPFTVTPNEPTTYTLSVQNSCGVVLRDSVNIVFNPAPSVFVVTDANNVCVPQTLQFNDQSISGNSADPIVSWLWNFGDGVTSNLQNPNHVYSTPGTYQTTLTVTTEDGCTASNASSSTTINAYSYPSANFSVNSTSLDIPYDNLICTNLSTGASSYFWTFGDGSSSVLENPSYSYPDVGVWTVQLISTSINGCSDTATTEVTTNANITFPNAFTPNPNGGNGGAYNENSQDNDVFFPFTKGVSEFLFQVFNRWGELIFESNDLRQGWDGYYKGKLCQQDVYIWKVNLKFNNGKSFIKTGDVTLLR